MLQAKTKGAVVASPTLLPLAKNSTFATVPSASVALAVSWTAAGASKVAPAVGEVRLTAGGVLLTEKVMGLEIASRPESSVATAVRV